VSDKPNYESSRLHPHYDLIIVGSGGGAMCALLTAHSLGKRAVVLEKESVIGGSTGLSGGVIWIPNSPLLAEAGVRDSFENARKYFQSTVTYDGPAVTSERRDAFLKAAPRMISFLRSQGMAFMRPTDDWPDYYDDRPGGLAEGRSLLTKLFNINELGPMKRWLSIYPGVAKMPMHADELPALLTMNRTTKGKLKALKLAWAMLKDKVTGQQHVPNGGALQGRMLQIALREDLPIFRNTPVTELLFENGKVTGVVAEVEGKPVQVRAEAVLVNAGGFSHNEEMRKRFQRAPATAGLTSANPGDTGEILENMIGLGAATDCLDTAWWVPTSRNLNGEWPEGVIGPDGRAYPFMHHLDLSFPFSILVDQDGRRFADESGSYMEIGERWFQRHEETGRAIPAWVIFDGLHRKRYGWGNQAPGKTPKSWLESGYMKKADSLSELAGMCGIDPTGLATEVARFNEFCRQGVDLDFNRGGRAFDRAHGDPTQKPNPNLGPIAHGPFFAVPMFPGDVGTAGGVVTDEYARVVRADNTVIPGLYATGNATASIFGRVYPGAGASIAASYTFGYIAAHHSSSSNELSQILS
jgi:3-oxosteroid 1-dehydrogenase